MGKAAASTESQTMAQQVPGRKLLGEWFWRLLGVVMLAAAGGVMWIAYQPDPPPPISSSAFEASAKERAARNAQGVIAPAAQPAQEPAAATPAPAVTEGSEAPQGPRPEASASAAAAQPQPAPVPKEPLVNVEKLRLSQSIETPISEKPKKK